MLDAQGNDETLEKIHLAIRSGKPGCYHETSDNVLMFEKRLCTPYDEKLKDEIMSEAHDTP